MSGLTGQAAIVTGAAQGLGYAIALAYAREGMRVTMMDVKTDRLNAAAAAIHNETGAELLALPADLSDAKATTTTVNRALDRFGTPRVLIHNAAILIMRPFGEVSFEEWTATVNVGIQAAYLLTQAVWQPMTDAGGGSIVYVSSRSGIEGFVDESAYCTAKHGLEGLMKCLSMEGTARNIAVNTVTPGMLMHTPMSEQNYTEEAKKKWVDPILLTPAFVTLARQDAKGITGQRLSAWELSQPA
jgi:3-hydroxybutyrate dehydrogenase